MVIDNTYTYEISEIRITREKKEPIEYFQLRIKHRSLKKTTVVFTHNIRRSTPDAFQTLLDLSARMKRLHY